MNGRPHLKQARDASQGGMRAGLKLPAGVAPLAGGLPEKRDLETLSREELIALVHWLRTQVVDPWMVLAHLSFGLTVALIPWRYRFTLLERPNPPIYTDYTYFLLFVPDIFMLFTLAAWLASLRKRPRRIFLGPAPISLPLAGLSLLGGLSILHSLDPALSAYHAVRMIFLFGFYLYIANEIHSLDDLYLPAALLIISQGIPAVGQVLLQRSIGLQRLGEYALDPSWNGVSVAIASGERFLRAYGLSDHPNILGGCLAFALLIVLIRLAARPNPSPAGAGIFALGCTALLGTLSRSAWIAFGGGLLLAIGFFWHSRQSQAIQRGLALGLAALVVLTPVLIYTAPYLGIRLGLNNSFQTVASENQSIGERALLNQAANRIFAAHPLAGVGLGAFPIALKTSQPDLPVNYQPAHLVLLDAAAETGLFGGLCYALLLSAPWLALWMQRKRLTFSPFMIGACALLLAVSLVGLFDYYTWLLAPGRLWAWLAWGLWAGAYRNALKGPAHIA